MPLTRFGPSFAGAVLIGAVVACSSPTGMDGLAVSLRTLSVANQEEWTQWPATPTIAGGDEATVSGLRPRTYRVRVSVAGLEERAEGAATITAP